MEVLFYILLSTILISFISFIGVLTLFLKERFLNKILLVLVAFSAGALIGGAFLHLIPEAIAEVESKEILKIFLFLILGFSTFYILEHFIYWHHHHSLSHPEIHPFSYLILISDAIHNFIDGVIIAASFLISLPTGLAVSLAIALHEIPQELGDFGILIYGGFKKARALLVNFLTAFTAILGGVAGFFLYEIIGKSVVFLLPFAAGTFLYIGASDLIPEIKNKFSTKKSLIHFFIFLLGILIMWII
jgi:zinc and cadmium transporter